MIFRSLGLMLATGLLVGARAGELPAEVKPAQVDEIRGDNALKSGDANTALLAYTSALITAPAGSESAQKIQDKAIEAASRLAKKPLVLEDAKFLMSRGKAFVAAAQGPQDYVRAAVEMNKALTVAPWWATGYYNAALAEEAAGEFAEAHRHLKAYLKLEPEAKDKEEVTQKLAEVEVHAEQRGVSWAKTSAELANSAPANASTEAEAAAIENAYKNPYKPFIDASTHIRGNSSAPITIVTYSDFQCPYSARGDATVGALREKYGRKLRFIFKNLPLTAVHPLAMSAAKWFEAVSIQSPEKAWTFHDMMFQNQGSLSVDFFRKTVANLGLNVNKAAKDAESQAVADKIESDVKEAKDFGFTGTPGFLINGVPVRGAYPIEVFEKIIHQLDLE